MPDDLYQEGCPPQTITVDRMWDWLKNTRFKILSDAEKTE